MAGDSTLNDMREHFLSAQNNDMQIPQTLADSAWLTVEILGVIEKAQAHRGAFEILATYICEAVSSALCACLQGQQNEDRVGRIYDKLLILKEIVNRQINRNKWYRLFKCRADFNEIQRFQQAVVSSFELQAINDTHQAMSNICARLRNISTGVERQSEQQPHVKTTATMTRVDGDQSRATVANQTSNVNSGNILEATIENSNNTIVDLRIFPASNIE